MWRWRHNPLRRRSDVVEAWAGLATVVMASVGAPLAGLAAGQSVDTTLRRAVAAQRAERHEVRATVLSVSDAPATVVDPDDTNTRGTSHTARISWRTADGTLHKASVIMIGRHPAGSTLPLWTDRRGRPAQPPLDTTTATTNAVAAGLGAAATVIAFLLSVRQLLSWRILRRRLADWEREWSRVGQDWGRAGAGG
jgi:hypothetical protein